MSSVGVIGAGAWGSAIAKSLAAGGNDVEIWALEPDVVESINVRHENKFLPGFTFSDRMTASGDIAKVASNKNFLIFASPSLYLERTVAGLCSIPSIADGSTCIGILTKGFIPSGNGPRLIVETLENILPESYRKNLVYIAGPSHAEEVAMEKITGLVAASENPMNSIRFRELLKTGRNLLVFSSLDVIGVQICAAAKNVIAVAFGILDGISETSDIIGDNTESLLLAAGLNEIQTVGREMGATHMETFTSVSGVGDLDVTCRSKYGRNRRFGLDIVHNHILDNFSNLDDLIANIVKVGYLPEGAVACKYVNQLAESRGLYLPISQTLYKILNKNLSLEDAVGAILAGKKI